MVNTQILKAEIVRNFGTQQRFAQELGWHPNKLSNLMQHKYVPDINELEMLLKKLKLTEKQFFEIFFADSTTK